MDQGKKEGEHIRYTKFARGRKKKVSRKKKGDE